MQINRLMEIVFVLLSKDIVTAKELADKFSVSIRTIYRDIDSLSLANIPVIMTKGKNGGISLLNNYKLDKAMLTDSDKHELMSSLNILGSLAPSESCAADKLRAIFGASDSDWIEIDFDDWSNEHGKKELFEQIKKAIINKFTVKFNYHSMSGSADREVLPLKMCFKGQAWYLYGYCTMKKDYRFFKLNRIKDFVVTDGKFNLTINKSVLGEFKGYAEKFICVSMIISKEKAFRVYDEFKDIKVLENGDFLVNASLPEGEWMFEYIATFLGDCKIVEPQSLKDKMRNIYDKSLKNI